MDSAESRAPRLCTLCTVQPAHLLAGAEHQLPTPLFARSSPPQSANMKRVERPVIGRSEPATQLCGNSARSEPNRAELSRSHRVRDGLLRRAHPSRGVGRCTLAWGEAGEAGRGGVSTRDYNFLLSNPGGDRDRTGDGSCLCIGHVFRSRRRARSESLTRQGGAGWTGGRRGGFDSGEVWARPRERAAWLLDATWCRCRQAGPQ